MRYVGRSLASLVFATMPNTSERLVWLARQFDSLIERLHESPSLEERTKLLQRMKALIVEEIDTLIMFALNREKHDTTGSPQPDQTTAESR